MEGSLLQRLSLGSAVDTRPSILFEGNEEAPAFILSTVRISMQGSPSWYKFYLFFHHLLFIILSLIFYSYIGHLLLVHDWSESEKSSLVV